jgi:hypothetical protein
LCLALCCIRQLQLSAFQLTHFAAPNCLPCLLHAMHQVCTLSAQQLRDAAAGQLSAWVAQQHDLEVPAAGLNIELVS